jgi:hypothetical protein
MFPELLIGLIIGIRIMSRGILYLSIDCVPERLVEKIDLFSGIGIP